MYEILGICDYVNSCDCCGKNNLKKTIAIQFSESNEIKYFGCVCAKNPLKGLDINEIKRAENRYKNLENVAWSMTFKEYKKRGGEFLKIDNYTQEYKDLKLRDEIFKEYLNQLKNGKFYV